MSSTGNPFDWQQRNMARRARDAPPAYSSSSSAQAPRADYDRQQPIPPPPFGNPPRADNVPRARPHFPDQPANMNPSYQDPVHHSRSPAEKHRRRRDAYQDSDPKDSRRRRDVAQSDSESDNQPRRHREHQPSPRRSRREPVYDDDEPTRRRRPKGDDKDLSNYERSRRDPTDRHRRTKDYDDGDAAAAASAAAAAAYDREMLRRRDPERRDRRNHYSDELESDDLGRRRRSVDRGYDTTSRRRDDYDRGYHTDSREARKRREAIYDRDREARRSDRRSRYYSDEEEFGNRRREAREPREIKVGKYDIGPYVEKGQKHYKTFAPIVTPIVMNLAKTYMAQKGGGGGRR